VLELGGKSPVVLGPAADFELAAKRIALGKTLNAGQICLSPDHVFVPSGREREFAEAMRRAITKLYPNLLDNDDYTAIISPRQRDRLLSCLADATEKGAEVIEINPAGERFDPALTRKLPPTLLLNVTADMKVMQDEIFGPFLPVIPYRDITEVIQSVNSRPRPLAVYYFGGEDETCRKFLDHTASGGVTIDDVLLHVANENLPFGGVGDSGMGSYHGHEGFKTFSHARAIVKCGWKSPNDMMTPPYGPRSRKLLKWMLNRERKAATK
jgi:coniferyl-aldehyde dehydrogenase